MMTENKKTKLTVAIYSFGFKYGPAPIGDVVHSAHASDVVHSGHNGGFVFDCRVLPNPFWEEELRPYRGDQQPVKVFMLNQPVMQHFKQQSFAMVCDTVARCQQLERTDLMVSFGCTGGRHRSVYLAVALQIELYALGVYTTLQHRDWGEPHLA